MDSNDVIPRFFAVLGLLLLTACQSSSSNFATLKPTGTSVVPTVAPTREKIAECWGEAGLSGDIYKFLTPAELQGLQKVGKASQAQVQQFKSCAAV